MCILLHCTYSCKNKASDKQYMTLDRKSDVHIIKLNIGLLALVRTIISKGYLYWQKMSKNVETLLESREFELDHLKTQS